MRRKFGAGEKEGPSGLHFKWGDQEVLTKKVAFEQRPQGSEGANQAKI